MSLDDLKNSLPDYAKDTKLNLGSVLGNSSLTPQRAWGAAVACAWTARSPVVIRAIVAEAAAHLDEAAMSAAKAAASIMAMNNVFYRGKHFLGSDYDDQRAGLRMQVIGSPGVDKVDFELWCLAASAIKGCEACVASHEKVVVAGGLGREDVMSALRIAATVNAAAVTLDGEAALVG